MRRRGFTLVELLVVLVVIAILAGVSVGSLASLRSSDADTHPRELALTHARAIRQGHPTLLRTDSGWIRLEPDGSVLHGAIGWDSAGLAGSGSPRSRAP